MTINETLPLCPDTELDDSSPTALSEPVEVGPFSQGVVFVKLAATSGSSVTAEVGISPSGYEDWQEHWTTVDSIAAMDTPGTYALRIGNFGNWLRVRFVLDDPRDGASATVIAWFSGDG